jgi:hypothetical protein
MSETLSRSLRAAGVLDADKFHQINIVKVIGQKSIPVIINDTLTLVSNQRKNIIVARFIDLYGWILRTSENKEVLIALVFYTELFD